MRVETPKRVTHTYTQTIRAAPANVYPLLCPVRERDWTPDWDPEIVYTETGIAEKDCIFLTGDGDSRAIWIINHYDPDSMRIGMYKITPDTTICRITISLAELKGGETTATVSYSMTSLGGNGDKALEEFTAAYYESFMKDWETQINHYLVTGKKLVG